MIDRSDLRTCSATCINPLFVPTQDRDRWYWISLINTVRFGIVGEAWVLVDDDIRHNKTSYAPATWEFA